MATSILLTFNELRHRGVVPNRTTLMRWQKNINFPRGFLIGPNRRVWTEDEIETWLAERARANGNPEPEAA